MRRLFRSAFNGAAVMSAALCVASVALWVRSYRTMDIVNWTREWPTTPGGPGHWRAMDVENMAAVSNRGMLLFERSYTKDYERAPDEPNQAGFRWDPGAAQRNAYAMLPHGDDSAWDRIGVHPWNIPLAPELGRDQSMTGVVFPTWTLAALTSLAPICRVAKCRRRRRVGCCPVCGYDLRATPEAGRALLGRCPECGRVSGESGAKA